MDRTVVGCREFARVTAGLGPAAVGKVAEASPVLADGVSEFIFADVFSRPGLSARERELVTVAVLCALGGAEPQLGLHIPAALEAGADPDELIAMCEQIAPYAGFPRALNGLRAVRGVLEERGLPLPLPAERVPLGDHETVVTDVGEGDAPPVVLIHPLGLDRLVWRQVIRALPAGRRALAFDLRGHGAAGGAPPARPGALAADIASLLAARGVEGDIELVGAGTSAGAALSAARCLGGRARAVTLLGPLSVLPSADGQDPVSLWLRPGAASRDGWVQRYLRDRVARAAPAAWEGLDVAPAPAGGVRLRAAVGGDDAMAAGARDLSRALGAEMTEIAGAGNLLPCEAPDAVARLIAGA